MTTTAQKEREYAVAKSLVDALAAHCAASSDDVIELLTGHLWDEEEAKSIKAAKWPH